MSIRRRLWNVMRSELGSLQERARDHLEELRFGGLGRDRRVDGDVIRPGSDDEQLRRYYANLEIAPGASFKEVKSAYRRLMRSYHPDRHVDDPEKLRVANEVSQQLREAYEAIREELRRQGKAS